MLETVEFEQKMTRRKKCGFSFCPECKTSNPIATHAIVTHSLF